MAAFEKNNAFIPWLIMLGLWAALQLMLTMTVAAPVFDGALLGPDAYMRLVRVTELLDGGGWYDIVIDRSNAPFGDPLHWTRPMDMLILLLTGLLSPFVDRGEALFIAGAAISPIITFFCCFVAAWTARPLVGRDQAFLAVFILLLQPAVLSYTMAGRADHHALQFFVFLLCIGATVRLLDKASSVKSAVFAGVSYGVALWISIELLLLVALCQTALALCWLREGGHRPSLLLAAGGGFLAMTAVALVLERPPATILSVEYDRLSIIHLTLAALTVGFWAIACATERIAARRDANAGFRARLGAAGLTAVASVLLLNGMYADFFTSPFASIDPRIVPIWHEWVTELEPLVPTDLKQLGRFLFFIGAAVPCLLFLGALIWRQRLSLSGMRWIFIAVLLAVYFALALRHLRFAPFVEIVSVFVLAEMVARLIAWSENSLSGLRQFAVKCGATFVLILGTLLAGTFVLTASPSVEASENQPECRISHIAALLNDPSKLGARPLIISGMLDHGPELLYRTPHATISAPYHRNGDGIWDSHRLLAATDAAESRAIIARRGIDLILVCPSIAERRFYLAEPDGKNIYSRLIAGETPAWLERVAVDTSATDGFQFYRVKRPTPAG